jgi:hypothetical protein
MTLETAEHQAIQTQPQASANCHIPSGLHINKADLQAPLIPKVMYFIHKQSSMCKS